MKSVEPQSLATSRINFPTCLSVLTHCLSLFSSCLQLDSRRLRTATTTILPTKSLQRRAKEKANAKESSVQTCPLRLLPVNVA